jgi:hypothetical protein
LVPAPDSGDDVVGLCLPDEGLRLTIMLVDEAVDGSLEVDDRMEYAVFQSSARQLGEESLDGIEPRAGRLRWCRLLGQFGG